MEFIFNNGVLEKMKTFIESGRTIAELEKESAEIQGGINNLL